MPYDRPRLLELFRARALKFGQFTLASGKLASYYLDGKQITLESEGLSLISQGLLDLLPSDITAVGGMSIGADPIVAGVLSAAAVRGRPLNGFLVRKESKGHGTQKFVEGPVTPGQKVVIVEDVVTTGGSSLEAAKRATDFGLEVVQVLAIIDRLEGGRRNFKAAGLEFHSLLTIKDFGIPAPEETAIC